MLASTCTGRSARLPLVACTLLATAIVALVPAAGAQNTPPPATASYLYVAGTWPDPVYFHASPLKDQISEFAVLATDSSLTRIGAVPNSNPAFPGGVHALAQGGPWLFVDGGASGPWLVYRIESDGSLGEGKPAITEHYPAVIALEPTGHWAIWRQDLMHGPVFNLYRVSDNGTLTDARPLPFDCFLYPLYNGTFQTGSFFDPSGTLFFALPVPSYKPACNGVYKFDAVIGGFSAAPVVAPELKQPGLSILGLDATGTHLYTALALTEVGAAHPSAEVLVFDVDPKAGAVTLHSRGEKIVGNNAVFAGGFIFAQSAPTMYVYRIDPATEKVTDTGQRAATNNGWNIMLAADANTNTLAVPVPDDNTVEVYHWDAQTGALAPAPGSPYQTGTAPWIALIVNRPLPNPPPTF